jgi:predicted N-acyltransferase
MPLLDGLHFFDAIGRIDPQHWDALAHPAAPPCLRHAYLHALEASACVSERCGWMPRHATFWKDGRLLAAMPLYLKMHSWGEYVFDWAWARAYQAHGLDYYPKWLAAIPFTPIPGPRMLGHDPAARLALMDGVLRQVEDSGLSSFHILFPDDGELALLPESGFAVRHGVQFHWENGGGNAEPYPDFEAFLAGLNHDKRKKIRQERRRASIHGLNMRWLDGRPATHADWAFLYRCYANTYAVHGASPHLNEDFFLRLAGGMADEVLLLLAERGHEAVACAFFLRDDDSLYGRYWGTTEMLPFLHFELCYYQAIEYCIRQGLRRFEGGAQGEHKLSRGLMPVRTQSAHWIADPRFRTAVDDYLERERTQVGFYLEELNEHAPYRRENP